MGESDVVSIPSNRVFSSDLTGNLGQDPKVYVSIPSNRVFSSDSIASEHDVPVFSLNPLKSGLLF